MAKYLGIANYHTEGVRGLLKDGGSKRRDAIAKAVESLGGKLEAFYYAFGDNDAYILVDLPDNVAVAAISLAANVTGAASNKTVVLLTPEEIDAATQMAVAYTAPGK